MELKKNSRNFIRIIAAYFREIDFVLFATVVAISLFGVLNMSGISGSGDAFFKKQVLFAAVGIATMVCLSFLNYRYLKDYSYLVFILYLSSIALLILTLYSREVRGVNAWLILGDITIEPSELAKLVIIILMAKYFSQRHILIRQFRHIVISGIYFAIPAAIIIIQPDLGSAIIFTLIWAGMLMAAGINKKHLLLLILVGAVVVSAAWLFVLKPYQKDRITSFLNPYSDPRGSGYNLIQSKIAVGSGYIWGKGLGAGTQINLGFLPESHNDFVFAATGEQFGLAGMLSVFAAIMVITIRIIAIGRNVTTNFGKLFSVGMAIFIFAHAFIGAGVNIGLLPVTGIPFPFLSSGGSNLLALMVGIGTLQSIKRFN